LTGTIGVGTPPVSSVCFWNCRHVLIWWRCMQTNFTVVFDTDLSDSFLPASTCDSSCSGHELYDPSASSTAKTLRNTFNLKYSDQTNVTGDLYSDTIAIAGLTAINQTFGAVRSATPFTPAPTHHHLYRPHHTVLDLVGKLY
jgi:hypothetical protein